MNKHIELVKKWLADPKSVTKTELKNNDKLAAKAMSAQATYKASTVQWVTYWSVKGDVKEVKSWIEKYEELVK